MRFDDIKSTLILGFLALVGLRTPSISAFLCKKWSIFKQFEPMAPHGNTVLESSSGDENSLPCCPPGSMNCIRTSWTIPRAKDRSAIASKLLEILQSYPQEGQSGVDKGGWKIANGDLQKTGQASLEYKSGVGPFAILFNFGKPFIDDLQIKIVTANKVELRSPSRIGKSDLGVNKKRLQYLGEKARALGWDVPDPSY
jgi:Protein of unknown function (DUF1499)